MRRLPKGGAGCFVADRRIIGRVEDFPMGIVREVPPAALVAGVFSAEPELMERAAAVLAGKYGPVEAKSPVFDFTMTDYYTGEMGENLKKRFYCFSEPVSPADLPEIKLFTNGIESEFARERDGETRRRVNMDPGYVTLSKLVLASTKDYSHRIYVGGGIYAEVTLRFVRGTFAPLETTYPDYRIPLAIEFFNGVREYVKRNRAAWTRKNV